jgi:hypothetical protein
MTEDDRRQDTDDKRQDPQDKQFGASAARDQERVDQLEREGVDEEELPDEPSRSPRAGGKAEPDGED